MANDKFTYFDSFQNEHTISFEENDFNFVQQDKKLFDQKIQTKPTTFFKDAMRRFTKNKSSVVGAYILGVIILLAIFVPVISPYDIKTSHPYENKLAPKLFDAGFGWWDGCRSYKHIAIDVDWDTYDATNGQTISGYPDGFQQSAIINGQDGIKYENITYIHTVNKFAHGGYLRLNIGDGSKEAAELTSWDGHAFNVSGSNTYTIKLSTIDPRTLYSDWNFGNVAEGYSAYFVWNDETAPGVEYRYELGKNIGVGENTFTINLAALSAMDPDVGFIKATQKPHLSIVLDPLPDKINNVVFDKILFESSVEAENEELLKCSITHPNDTLLIKAKNEDGTYNDYYWTTYHGNMNLYHAKMVYGSFRYDTYEAAFGDIYTEKDITVASFEDWKERGWLDCDVSIIEDIKNVPYTQRQATVDKFINSIVYTEEGHAHCPLHYDEEHPITGVVKSAGGIVAVEFSGTVTRWKLYYPDRDSCPRYLFGTTESGKDLVKLTFAGLRTSLLLGLIVAVVTFAFGLVWGAIAGYFGGWTDMLMERFTDILGGVPWIVVMTLAIVRFGSSFGVFIMAMCLTGWIGTSSLTRTQFYRFKNREYILASRTLGASDFRLIFRHILPNAVGTIVTSSVFMITSVIYREATIAYLNLGLKGMDSFGVLLADNQRYIETFPHLILFPSFIMLFMMISFNLFGNGLRDAFNPSLKGQE